MHDCYGLYSNVHRRKIRKAASALSPPPIIEEEPAYVPSKGWAEMIRKLYEVDPLCCPSCGGQMSIISFIEEPKIIDRITAHHELTFEAERPPPPHNVQEELLMAAEEREESNLNLMVWRFWFICFAFLVVDLVVLGVILLFLALSRLKLWKIVRDLE